MFPSSLEFQFTGIERRGAAWNEPANPNMDHMTNGGKYKLVF